MKKVDNTIVLTMEEVQVLLAFVDAEFKEDVESYLTMYKLGPYSEDSINEAEDFVKSNEPDFYKMVDGMKELMLQYYLAA